MGGVALALAATSTAQTREELHRRCATLDSFADLGRLPGKGAGGVLTAGEVADGYADVYEAARARGYDTVRAYAAARGASFGRRARLRDPAGAALALEAIAGGHLLDGIALGDAYGVVAQNALADGDYERAATYFSHVLDLAVEHRPAQTFYPYRNLSRALLSMGDTARAIATIHDMIAAAAEVDEEYRPRFTTPAMLRLGEIYAAQGRYPRADSCFALLARSFRELVAIGGGGRGGVTAEVRAAQARYAITRGRYSDAAAYIDTLELTHPNFALVLRSRLETALGNPRRAYATLLSVKFGSPADRHGELPALLRLAEAVGDATAALGYARELAAVRGTEIARLKQRSSTLTGARLSGILREQQLAKEAYRQRLALAERRTSLVVTGAGVAILALLLLGGYGRHRRIRGERSRLSARVDEQNGQLAAANARLERQVKDLGRFNFLLSHDLREPVRSIVSFGQLAARHLGQVDRVREDLGYVNAGARQLTRLLDGIEAYRAADDARPRYRTTDPRRLLGELLGDFRKRYPAADLQSAATASAEAAAAASALDPALTRRILAELLGNALRFAGPTGPAVIADVREGEGSVTFVVRDAGVGFAREHREAIFEVFSRLHRREVYAGAGIGLATARRLADRLGGTLTCTRAEEGLGCTFELTLPHRPARCTTRACPGAAATEVSL